MKLLEHKALSRLEENPDQGSAQLFREDLDKKQSLQERYQLTFGIEVGKRVKMGHHVLRGCSSQQDLRLTFCTADRQLASATLPVRDLGDATNKSSAAQPPFNPPHIGTHSGTQPVGKKRTCSLWRSHESSSACSTASASLINSIK